MRRVREALLPVVVLVGCNPFGAGPCVHTYHDPVLAITAVWSSTGAAIDSVVVRDVTVDGRPVEGSALLLGVARRVDLREDGGLLCRVDCGFGTEEGTYGFVASADGHQPQTVTLEAGYAEFEGGCPSSNAGSTNASLQLTAAS